METWRSIINIGIAVVSLLAIAGLIAAAWFNRFDPVLTELVVQNFAAIIGLPFAFLGAFIVVALFRQSEGNIEFKVIGVEIKGAAGQILLWLICFLSIAVAIDLLWNP